MNMLELDETERVGDRRTRLASLMPWALCFLLGFIVGGYAFARSQPRSFLALARCTECWRPADLAGLIGSVLVQRAPGLMPFVEIETDRSIAIKEPLPGKRLHYVIIPKRDIRNLSELTPSDAEYVMDAIRVAQELIARHHMRKYEFVTNGPGLQSVTYLHFHLEEVYR
jgi:hypothetical protein